MGTIYMDFKKTWQGQLAAWTHFFTSPDSVACVPYSCVADDNSGGNTKEAAALVDTHNGNVQVDFSLAGALLSGNSVDTYNTVCATHRVSGTERRLSAGTWLFTWRDYCADSCSRLSSSDWENTMYQFDSNATTNTFTYTQHYCNNFWSYSGLPSGIVCDTWQAAVLTSSFGSAGNSQWVLSGGTGNDDSPLTLTINTATVHS